MDNFYIYKHIRLDKNEVFYIGMGKDKRAYNKSNRNSLWKKIVNKSNYSVEIIYNELSLKDAFEIEKYLILLYGRRDLNTGTLANFTNGGDGASGVIYSTERRSKISKFMKNKIMSEETKLKISNTLKQTSHLKGRSYNTKKVINTKTNEVYNTIKEVSILYNIKYTTLKQNLSGYRTNKTIFKYYLE